MGRDIEDTYDPKQNYTSVYFYVLDDDYSALMYNPTTANNAGNSFLVARQGAFTTRSGRPSQEINQNAALQAELVIPDTVPPSLLSGGIDYNLGLITLIFSEPIGNGGVATGDITLDGLGMQSAADCGQYGSAYQCKSYIIFQQNAEVAKVNVSNYARTIVYQIGATNLNSLKRVEGIADSLASTYFSVWRPIANDTNGNQMTIIGAERFTGVAASFYVPDSIPPVVKYWIYDCAAGAFSIVFDEPIDPDYFNYSAIAIVSTNKTTSANQRIVVRINDLTSDLVGKQTELSEVLTIQFSQEKLDDIFSNAGILSSKFNSFLILDPYSVTDTSTNKNVYLGLDATLNKPMQVGIFAPDKIQPQLVKAQLDMTTKVLTLQFTKVMNISTISFSELSFQTQATSKGATTLSLSSDRAALLTKTNSKIVEVQLSASMFATMKQLGVGTAFTNSFLYFSSKFMADRTVSANRVVEVTASAAVQVASYVPDSVKPFVSSWFADMGSEKLVITFSEPVDTSNNAFYIRPNDITLRDDSIINPGSVSFSLSRLSAVSRIFGSTIDIQLSADDASSIKTKAPLCTTRDRCFLSHTSALAQDIATYNPSTNEPLTNQIAPASFIQASVDFIIDAIPPALVSYEVYDQLNGFCTIDMIFTEPVKSQFFDPTGVRLYGAASPKAAAITLSASTFSPDANSRNVRLYMSRYDYIRMKLASIGYSGISSFFLSIYSNAVTDVAGNAVTGALSKETYLVAGIVSTDMTNPFLLALSLSTVKVNFKTSCNLTAHFNEVVNIKTLDLSHFVLYSSSSGNRLTLANAKVLSVDHAGAVVISLDPMLDTIIKVGLTISQVDTNLYIDRTGSVVDEPLFNELTRMTVGSAIQAGQRYLTFRCDLARGLFYVSTAFPYDAASIWDPTMINLVSVDTGVKVPFTILDTLTKLSADTIMITASAITLNTFKESMAFDDMESIALSFGQKSFVDSYGYFLYAAHQINCVQLLADTVSPQLTTFSMDLGHGLITLTMTKVVQVSLVNLGFLMLQSTQAVGPDTVSVSLANAVVLTSTAVPSSTIVISLNGGSYPTLRDNLNVQTEIATSAAKTYLAVGKSFVGDTSKSPNYMTPTVRMVDSLVLDTIKPQLKSWSIDLDARLLKATYDEAVNPSSNIAGNYLLLRDPAVPSPYEMYLSSSSTDTSVTGNTVVIKLSQTDLNNMYRMTPHLCSKGGIVLEGGNCFLSIRQNAIADIKGNGIAGIVHLFATLPPAVYVRDNTPPLLTNYTLSIQDGFADFYFDKVVDCRSVDMNRLILQFRAYLGTLTDFYQMTASAPNCLSQLRFNTQFHLDIDLVDLVRIKSFKALFKKRDYAFARPQDGFVADSFGNTNLAVQDGNALRVQNFYGDTVPPRLISYTISSSKEVYLYFTEPVNLESLKIEEIMFSDEQWPNTKQSWYLQSAVLKSADETKTILIIALGADYTRLASSSPIFNYQDKTLLSFDSNFAEDTSGNSIMPIKNSSALEYGPSVLFWDLNLMTGELQISFPELMRIPFSPKGIGIQPSMQGDDTSLNVTITTTTDFTALDYTTNSTFVVALSSYDLNRIKFYGVARTASSAYLTSPFGLSSSAYVGTLLPYLKSVERDNKHAMQVRFLTADIQPPIIQSFRLNLNTGKMYILIDEPVSLPTFAVNGMTLVSEEGSYAVLTACSEKGLKVLNITEVVVSLCTPDLNYIKIATKVGTLTRLIASRGAFTDVAGNAYLGNTQDTPVFATTYVPDVSPPFLTSAILNLTTGILSLAFNEVVNISSVDATKIYIGSVYDYKQGTKFQLTRYSLVEEIANWVINVDLKTYRTDMASLVSLGNVGTTVLNTFVSVNNVSDIFGNSMLSRFVLKATEVVADYEGLAVKSFDFVSSSSKFILFFTKEVAASTFDCSDFRLISSASATPPKTLEFVKSSCVVSTTGHSYSINFTYSSSIDATFTSRSSCFLYVPTIGNTREQASNGRLSALSAVQALQVGVVIVNGLLNVNTRVLTLIFSKDVVFNTLVTTNLGFYSSITGSSFYLQSTSATALLPSPLVSSTTTTDNKGTLTLSINDINLLKALDFQPGQLFIISKDGASSTGAIRDIDGIALSPATILGSRDTSQLVSKIVMDTVAPVIVGLTTSIGTNLIRIDFDEPVRASSVVVTNLVFQSSASSVDISYKLTSAAVVSFGNSVNLTISTVDSEAIKLTKGLMKSSDTAYLSFAFKMAADYAGNYLATVKSTSALQVNSFIPDRVSPLLLSFTLDMTKTLLVLSFSEPVRTSSFNVTEIVLQSRFFSEDGAFYSLTGGSLMSNDSSTITIKLSDVDVFNIKAIKGLCRNPASTYIRHSSKMARDIAGNSIVAIQDRLAQLVNKFTFDTIPPTVKSISIDVNLGRIYVRFSEQVQLLLVAVRGLTVYSSTAISATTTKKYTLTPASTVEFTELYSDLVQVNLAPKDFDIMKYRYPLLHSRETSAFTVGAEFAQDTFFNPVVVVTDAMLVESYSPDLTPPLLLSYSLDMQVGTMTLQFSESMFARSLDSTQFIIQANRLRRFGHFTGLHGSVSVVGTEQFSSILSVKLSSDTIVNMKYLGIGTTATKSLLTWTNTAFQDQFGNFLPPNWDASIRGFEPKRPNSFTADTTSCALTRWQLDRSEMIAYLYFDEPVILRNLTMLMFHTGATGENPQSIVAGVDKVINGTNNVIIGLKLKDFCAWTWLGYKCNKIGGAKIKGAADQGFYQQLKLAFKDSSQRIYLSARAGTFLDFAYSINANTEIATNAPLREGSSGELRSTRTELGSLNSILFLIVFLYPYPVPDCSPCPDGQFALKLCTAITDRVCKPCSGCAKGSFLVSPCSAVADTICKPCSACPFNTYVSEACSPAKDAVCSPCTLCSAIEYETQKCELGKNTMCSSCKMCSFTDSAIQNRCESGPWVWWQMDNCCVDDTGKNTACNLVDYANMINTVVRSRHNLALPGTTVPPIPGSS